MTTHPPHSDPTAIHRMMELIQRLHPLPRSLTGRGLRQTLEIIGRQIPLERRQIPSGTPLYDWTVPPEWNWNEAWIEDPAGNRIVDAANHNLHLVGYSIPVDQTLELEALRPHLHTLPEHPDWIPYRTSYYNRQWGFCLPHRQYERLVPGNYKVRIDSTLEAGNLDYGLCILPGQTDEIVLISCHICHPSLANDNLSGVAVAVELARALSAMPRRHSWHFLFGPATYSALAWCQAYEQQMSHVVGGLVLACIGDAGSSTYKRSRQETGLMDRVMEQVLRESQQPFVIQEFTPTGYDQRQYCSAGFNLPVGSLMRTPNGQFPEYHTSADNLDLMNPAALGDSLQKCLSAAHILQTNRRYASLCDKGEIQLGQRGLYTTGPALDALLWCANYSDGRHDLLEIARRSGLPYALILEAADKLAEKRLLRDDSRA